MADVVRISKAGEPARNDATVSGAQVTGYYSTLNGDWGVSTNVSGIEITLSGRFDNPRYYTGDTAS